ncbi:MAG: hypothetical protein ABWY16_02970 [Pedobacter sp.]|uniref:hypothetical protein n=1 Tax=Pedobacter sp. TaxID=1411316 RepID=UPI003393D00C
MKVFTICTDGDRYNVIVHPDVINFLIIRHQSTEYLMMKLQGDRWRCLNDGPYCSYIPANKIYEMVTKCLNKA